MHKLADNEGIFYKSSYSTGTCSCVEVRFDGELIWLRDSKQLDDPAYASSPLPMITVIKPAWSRFVESLQSAEHYGDGPSISVIQNDDGGATLERDGVALRYRQDEWDAFLAGVRAGEFTLPGAST